MDSYFYILNLINFPNYASKQRRSVEHIGSTDINGESFQMYSVDGAKFAVACRQSHFNNVCVPLEPFNVFSLEKFKQERA